ncbi:MAG: bacteriohopanetetrol glucosamine biosynthesis glycosyltransferase HpnI [Bryobacteraceae bacterium]
MSGLLLVLIAGGLVYLVLTIVAAARYKAVMPVLIPGSDGPGISVLKPLAGLDLDLEANLRTFFEQSYWQFELLFAVRHEADPAAGVVRGLQTQYPAIPTRLVVTGEPPYANAKVYSLDLMKAQAQHDLLVMSDSDIRVTPDFLATIAAEFRGSAVGLATCPYRAVPGRGIWSTLEALGMNTHFLGGVLVARMLEGMKFALGPTIAAQRQVLDRMGGFDRLKDYLAEDFVMGSFAAEMGYGVVLSFYRIEHHIGSQSFQANWRHRIRWARSTRRSRPKGYLGEVFTNPLPFAVMLAAIEPAWWPALLLTACMRLWSALAIGAGVLDDPLTKSRWWLLPVQDFMTLIVWIGGFFGNHIVWRGRKYYLRPDGRFEPAP